MNKQVAVKNISEAIGTLIAKVCYKAADEFGSNLAERTSLWRQQQALSILEKSNEKHIKNGYSDDTSAPPRLVHHIIEEGSWNESDQVQEMWAGLLASSRSVNGDDESNLLFINILKQLTSVEVVIINYACENCKKVLTEAGWISSKLLQIELSDLVSVSGISDFHRLDRELDHLRSLELIDGGFSIHNTTADITPSGLALQMFVRCQGYVGSPVEFFGINNESKSPAP